jgi:tetratricopeptide (TPR) repeat protein
VSPLAADGEGNTLSEEAIRKLASLGYFDSGPDRAARENAPNPKDMTHIFRDLDIGSALFVRKQYAEAVRVFGRVHEIDPENLVVTLRLAVAHSVLGNEQEAEGFFERAREISPASIDLRHYHAMHYLRFDQYDLAAPLLESVLAEMPQRLPALEGMAQINQVRGDLETAQYYLDRIVAIKDEPVAELLQLGSMSMARQDTVAAIDYFEQALEHQGDEFDSAALGSGFGPRSGRSVSSRLQPGFVQTCPGGRTARRAGQTAAGPAGRERSR